MIVSFSLQKKHAGWPQYKQKHIWESSILNSVNKQKWKWKSLSHVRLFATPWTTQSMDLQARILEWVAVSFSRGHPNRGIKPMPPTLQADSLPTKLLGKPTQWLF